MNTSSLRKTAMAAAIAGTFTAAIPQAQADVVNFSWSGAFTILTPIGTPLRNANTDYVAGFYSDGDGYGAPYDGAYSGAPTTHGWVGYRTPVSGILSFDISNGAGVATMNPFMFFGDTLGSGPGTSVASALGMSYQVIDTAGTLVGTMLFNWNGGNHSLSFVYDASGMFASLNSMLAGGPTSTVTGVGALPASDGVDFLSGPSTLFLPLGPSPIAMKTRNAIGCEAQPLATQTNAWTISTTGNIANCDLSQDDGVGGSPAVSPATQSYNYNFDFMSLHLDSYAPTVPLPPTVWLFGSGLLGLVALARRRRTQSTVGT
jgi:hypothetical protein